MNEILHVNYFYEDWLKILLIVSTLLIIGMILNSQNKFQYIIRFWNLHRYFYYEKGHSIRFFNYFNFFGFFHRVIIYSTFLSLFILPMSFSDSKFLNFLSIALTLILIIVSKFLTEKILALFFGYKKKFDQVNLYRIGLKNFISIHFFFYLIIMIFGARNLETIIISSVFLFLFYYVFSSFYLFKKVSNGSLKSLVYFILYICTFEITPVLLFILLML